MRRLLPKPARDAGYLLIASSLERFGFIPRMSAGPVDFQGLDIEPAEAIKRAAGLPCLIDIAPEHLRNVGPVTGAAYFPCKKDAGNPFVETIVQYLQNRELDYASSALKRYHDSFQPVTIAETLGLIDDDRLHFLLHQPPLLTFPPWVRPPLVDYQAHLKQRQRNIEIENRKAGKNLSHEFGYHGIGPVGEAKGILEINRLTAITDSIVTNGYQSQKGPDTIRTIVMRARQEYRFLCTNGHHRTSALAALDYTSIPVSPLPETIDRDDVLQWPGVEAAVFTPDQALYIFDVFFDGQPPETALRWWRDMRPL